MREDCGDSLLLRIRVLSCAPGPTEVCQTAESEVSGGALPLKNRCYQYQTAVCLEESAKIKINPAVHSVTSSNIC